MIDELGIGVARDGPGTDLLESFFVNADDGNAIVDWASPAKAETGVESAPPVTTNAYSARPIRVTTMASAISTFLVGSWPRRSAIERSLS